MPTYKNRMLVVLILLMIGCWSGVRLEAARPMRPAGVLEKGGGIEELLKDPVTNMAAISLVLKGPSSATAAGRNAILNTKINGHNLASQAALSYLAGEALYWATFDRLRSGSIKTNQMSEIPRAEIIAKYLDAWTYSCQLGTDPGPRIRSYVLNRMKMLLSTTVFGASLPVGVKEQVVTRFIDVIEKQNDEPSLWSRHQKAGIYANLGIEQRLPIQIPKELPADREGLRSAMMLALAMHQPTQAVRFASVLEDRYAGYLRCDSNLWYEVYTAYRDAGSSRALPCLRALAEKNPVRCLELYDLSLKMETNKLNATMRDYLKCYLMTAQGKEPMQAGAVRAVAHRMFNEGLYVETLEIMERYYPTNAFWDITFTKLRGQCYEKLGQTNDAINAYAQHDWYKSVRDRESHDGQFCLKRLKSLNAEAAQGATEE
jgi:hypothetical protein